MIIQAEDNAFREILTRYTEAFDELLPYLSHKEECFFVQMCFSGRDCSEDECDCGLSKVRQKRHLKNAMGFGK